MSDPLSHQSWIIVLYGPGLHVLYNHHIRILWGLKYYQNRHMWRDTFLLEGPPTFSRPEAVGPKADSSNRLWFQFQAAGSPPLGETECFRKIAECIQPRQYRKLYLSEVKYKSQSVHISVFVLRDSEYSFTSPAFQLSKSAVGGFGNRSLYVFFNTGKSFVSFSKQRIISEGEVV